MHKHIVFALFASLMLIRSANADVTLITICPYLITQPGEYHLAQDLTCNIPPTGIGIEVWANDVELHFDGHTLTGPGFRGVRGEPGVTNLSIHGPGTITDFRIGIGLGDNRGALIVNMTTPNNLYGISILGGSDNTLISNTATGNDIGIALMGGTSNNTVRANQTDGNQRGIELLGSTGNLVQANQAHNNTQSDLYDDNTTCANTWKSNHFETTGGAGASCIQ